MPTLTFPILPEPSILTRYASSEGSFDVSPSYLFPLFHNLELCPVAQGPASLNFAYTQTAYQSVVDRLDNGESVAPHVKKRSARFRRGATTFKHNRNYACMCLEKPHASMTSPKALVYRSRK